jgi:hypothetical protein
VYVADDNSLTKPGFRTITHPAHERALTWQRQWQAFVITNPS